MSNEAPVGNPNEHLESLSPAPIWHFFRLLCNTPRPSYKEEAILSKIEQFAEQRGFSSERDEGGNLLVKRPATPGYEQVPVVTLQSHVDMVAQADVEHDFSKDPILTEVRDGWLWAKGTTLGADNGIGVAGALAVLADDELVHGPLEALFTVEEETSMGGALRLAPNWLQGRYLLNMDSEDRGEVYIGCAGGVHVKISEHFVEHELDSQWTFLTLSVSGLNGGHSGVEINQQKGSANQLLPRALLAVLDALEEGAVAIASYRGGEMSNAITRSASAVIAVKNADVAAISAQVAELEATLKQELAEVDAGVVVTVSDEVPRQAALSAEDSARFIRLLGALPYGVERYSDEVPGVVETSNNIGIVELEGGRLSLDAMVRSLRDSAALALAARIEGLARLGGFSAESSSFYPGWNPIPHSPLLTRFCDIHTQVEGHSPEVKVIHAGLECGIIGAQYPHLEMISFGPTIKGPHSPSERVELAAVEAFWGLLRGTIESLAKDPLPA
ncbi:beta-Ala-His dipeptidase [Carnimonas bestiolae]|uniref:beta-Ala-His dipeptidase n=1 Tax=Carnimonas bestiolae TaxID=3402172 RepID=UPI003EDC852C